MSASTHPPEVLADVTVTDALRADLTAAGFTVDGVDALWGTEAAASLHRGSRVAALRALDARGPAPLSTLATLFVLGLARPTAGRRPGVRADRRRRSRACGPRPHRR